MLISTPVKLHTLLLVCKALRISVTVKEKRQVGKFMHGRDLRTNLPSIQHLITKQLINKRILFFLIFLA